MNLTDPIESAELQFKQILEDFFIAGYDEKTLPSHGIDHHRRVWSYSKELLTLHIGNKPSTYSQLPLKLIIASYLHDIGMSVEPGIRHGKHSRQFCIQFLEQNHLPLNDYQDVLEAIENHDNKDYASNGSMNDLLSILSVADDLDAFGFTGIFRYSEIYLKRGIVPEKIGLMIRENAEKRFLNFIKTFGSDSEIVKKHIKRYNILDNFFAKYNEQLPSYHFGSYNPHGNCGVVELIKFSMNNNLQLKDLCTEPEKYTKNPLIKCFFVELEKEFSGF